LAAVLKSDSPEGYPTAPHVMTIMIEDAVLDRNIHTIYTPEALSRIMLNHAVAQRKVYHVLERNAFIVMGYNAVGNPDILAVGRPFFNPDS